MARTGFSLLELLMALALGLPLVALISQALLGELGNAERLTRLLRERAVAERALELMRIELQEAQAVEVLPGPITRPGCGLAGRTVLLHLNFPPGRDQLDRDVTYSMEPKPDAIWHGQALMRCGPAYELDGQIRDGDLVSRVWLDGLTPDRVFISQDANRVLQISLVRTIRQSSGKQNQLHLAMTFTALGIP